MGTMHMGCVTKNKCGGQTMAQFGWGVDVTGVPTQWDYLPVKVTGYIRCLQVRDRPQNTTNL